MIDINNINPHLSSSNIDLDISDSNHTMCLDSNNNNTTPSSVNTTLRNSNNNDSLNNTNSTQSKTNKNYILYTILNTINKNSNNKKSKNDSTITLTNSDANSKAYLNVYKKRRSMSIINLNIKQRIDNRLSGSGIDNNNTSKLEDDSYMLKLAQNYALTNKLLNERNIYSDPKDNYKRRTLIIQRKSNEFNFGFDLQNYGLFNTSNKRVEYIFYVSSVTHGSPAQIAGLKLGDVLLAINGVRVDQYKDLASIKKYFKERNSIRLIVLSENISKKLEYQKRIYELEKKVDEKLNEYETLCKQEELILRKSKVSIESADMEDDSYNYSSMEMDIDLDEIDDDSSIIETDLYLNVNNFKKDLKLTNNRLKLLKKLSNSKSTNSISSTSSITPPNTPKYNKNPTTTLFQQKNKPIPSSSTNNSSMNTSISDNTSEFNFTKIDSYLNEIKGNNQNQKVKSSISTPSLVNMSSFNERFNDKDLFHAKFIDMNDDSEWIVTRL